MTERKLATIRRIAEIKPIDGANEICAYRTDGWWIVDKIDKYSVNDLCIMCEIDSWIPTELAPFLSRGKEPREYNGIKGERLKTIKLRGQVSQGLLLPKDVVYQYEDNGDFLVEEGDDFSELLNITKWELSEKEFFKRYLANPEARQGGFPWFIPKSDQERIQNIQDKTLERWSTSDLTWEVTEKLEGSSMTVYYVNNKDLKDEGVCSRNINLKDNLENNKFWYTTNKFNILSKLKEYGRNLAVQGELVGPGVCGNHYKLDKFDYYVYNIWDIDNQSWLLPKDRDQVCKDLGLKHVPVQFFKFVPARYDREDFLLMSDGISDINNNRRREGLVFKCNECSESFKAVSNLYLLECK